MATHSSLRIPGTGEPGGLPSMGSHRVGHDRSSLAAAAAAAYSPNCRKECNYSKNWQQNNPCSWWIRPSTCVETLLCSCVPKIFMSKVCLGQREHFRGSPPNYSRDVASWFALCSSLLHTLSRNAESNETNRWNSRQYFFKWCFQLLNIIPPVLGRFLIISLPVNQLCQRYLRSAFQKVFLYALMKPK